MWIFLVFNYVTNDQTFHVLVQVQSVREVQRADKKPFLFEIIMTNGKRKMLVRCLWFEWLVFILNTDNEKSKHQPVVDMLLHVC